MRAGLPTQRDRAVGQSSAHSSPSWQRVVSVVWKSGAHGVERADPRAPAARDALLGIDAAAEDRETPG